MESSQASTQLIESPQIQSRLQGIVSVLEKKFEKTISRHQENLTNDDIEAFRSEYPGIVDYCFWYLDESYSTSQIIEYITPCIQDYKELLKSIAQTAKENSQIEPLTATEIRRVEKEILTYQKDLLDLLEKYVRMPEKDIKEVFEFDLALESGMAHVNLELDGKSVIELPENHIEVELGFKIDVIMETWEGEMVEILVGADLSLVIIEDDIYIQVSNLHSHYGEGAPWDVVNMIDQFEFFASEYGDHHIKIPLGNQSDIHGVRAQAMYYEFFRILHKYPVFTAYRKMDSGYALQWNEEFVDQLLEEGIINEWDYENMPRMQKEIRQQKILLEIGTNRRSSVIWGINEDTAIGELRFARASDLYSLNMHVDGVGYAEGNVFDAKWDYRGIFSSLVIEDEKMYSFSWKNGKLNFDVYTQDFPLSVSGDLTANNTYLDISFNSQDIGVISWVENHGKYKIHTHLDFSTWFEMKFSMDAQGEVIEGDFTITQPAKDIDIEDLNI